ncbi:MAG TPA: hypothetical protein VI653_09485 [Steroidobacteraceae bacterium]
MSNETPKEEPAQLQYSRAVSADPSAYHQERVHRVSAEQEKLNQARHAAFVQGHPFARKALADAEKTDE